MVYLILTLKYIAGGVFNTLCCVKNSRECDAGGAINEKLCEGGETSGGNGIVYPGTGMKSSCNVLP